MFVFTYLQYIQIKTKDYDIKKSGQSKRSI